MRAAIRYVPEAIELDLAEPDLGHPDGHQILERHYHQSNQPRPEFNRHRPAFVCLRHAAGTNPGLYLKKINGHWWAVHYESSSCDSIRVPAPMSDAHRRQVEYWARAAEDAGWRVELGARLAAGTRPDALIRGPVPTSIEIQRDAMTAPAAVARSRKAQLGEVLDVWFSSRTPAPKWTFRVPSVLELGLPWDVVPPRRTAAAAGLRVIEPVRCSQENFRRCPETQGRQCQQHHPRERPWRNVLIDDVAARVPAGEIVPMRFRRSSRSHDVYLVPPSSLELYEELTGTEAGLSLGRDEPAAAAAPAARAAGHADCRSDQAGLLPAVRCFRCGEAAAGPGGVLCPGCRHDIEARNGYL
jgi:hypothetical protein